MGRVDGRGESQRHSAPHTDLFDADQVAPRCLRREEVRRLQHPRRYDPARPVVPGSNSVLEIRTAGDPDEDDVVWTNLSPGQLAETVTQMGTPISAEPVRNWLQEMRLRRRKIVKVLAGGHPSDRDAQFRRIAELKAEYADAGNPVFSIDTKAKERLGMLYRAGRVWTTQAFKAFDHDFPSWADGVVIPHGIYDLLLLGQRNRH